MNISELLGKTLVRCEKTGNDRIEFQTTDGETYLMAHSQDCCETVTIDDICGELADLVGSPILQAEESSNANENPEGVKPPSEYSDESWTWTFYRLATIKGSVVIRWYGSSNGYYSESVDFTKL